MEKTFLIKTAPVSVILSMALFMSTEQYRHAHIIAKVQSNIEAFKHSWYEVFVWQAYCEFIVLMLFPRLGVRIPTPQS